MRARAKELLLSSSLGRFGYGRIQEAWFERSYRMRRERYETIVAHDSAAYSAAAAVARARHRIARRGYVPVQRAIGEVHTFAYLPSNWSHQNQIGAALSALGPCTRFDYVSRGVSLKSLRSRESGHL